MPVHHIDMHYSDVLYTYCRIGDLMCDDTWYMIPYWGMCRVHSYLRISPNTSSNIMSYTVGRQNEVLRLRLMMLNADQILVITSFIFIFISYIHDRQVMAHGLQLYRPANFILGQRANKQVLIIRKYLSYVYSQLSLLNIIYWCISGRICISYIL